MTQKGIAPFLIILLIAAAIFGYLVYSGKIILRPPGENTYIPPKLINTDKIANWKTYTNEEYGYSFKYPTDAEFTEGGWHSVDGVFVPLSDGISLRATVGKDEVESLGRGGFQLRISVETSGNNTLNDLKKEIRPYDSKEDVDWTGTKIQETKVDGSPAIRGETSGPYGSYTIITIHNNQIFRLIFEPDISKTGEQIISSFKFQ